MSYPFHPSELAGDDGALPTTGALADALATARAIEGQLATGGVHPSADFADRVMTAVAAEARPHPAIAAGLAMRGGRLGSMVAALGDSWRVAFSGGRPLAVRSHAAAFVLVVILALGSLGGIAAVGAVRLLSPAEEPASPPSRLVLPTSNPTPTPTDGLEPTDTPEPSETVEPTATPEPNPTPDAAQTPRPGKTAEPTETPEPNETEEPDESDDHSGPGGGGDGDGSGGGGGG